MRTSCRGCLPLSATRPSSSGRWKLVRAPREPEYSSCAGASRFESTVWTRIAQTLLRFRRNVGDKRHREASFVRPTPATALESTVLNLTFWPLQFLPVRPSSARFRGLPLLRRHSEARHLDCSALHNNEHP